MTMTTTAPAVATVVTTFRALPGAEAGLAGWQARLSRAVAEFPGFVSAEAIPPVPPIQTAPYPFIEILQERGAAA